MKERRVKVACSHCKNPNWLPQNKHSDGWRIDTKRCSQCGYLIYNALGDAMPWGEESKVK